mmetsp:Transcript_19813/g.68276  ORF Transcript_19813/g.68276 Transcript_19813/m.68276 type:complete len:126 (+) Transcript_19813:956-1333(+)
MGPEDGLEAALNVALSTASRSKRPRDGSSDGPCEAALETTAFETARGRCSRRPLGRLFRRLLALKAIFKTAPETMPELAWRRSLDDALDGLATISRRPVEMGRSLDRRPLEGPLDDVVDGAFKQV